MNVRIPKGIARVGGIAITISGVVNAVLGARIGALWYDVYPGGKMGHVGILAGFAAIAIGLVILLLIIRMYELESRGIALLGGILTAVLGYLGAIAGALYIGTLGVILCYIAGIWIIIVAVSAMIRSRA